MGSEIIDKVCIEGLVPKKRRGRPPGRKNLTKEEIKIKKEKRKRPFMKRKGLRDKPLAKGIPKYVNPEDLINVTHNQELIQLDDEIPLDKIISDRGSRRKKLMYRKLGTEKHFISQEFHNGESKRNYEYQEVPEENVFEKEKLINIFTRMLSDREFYEKISEVYINE